MLFSDLHGLGRLERLIKFAESVEYDRAFGLGDYGSLFENNFNATFGGAINLKNFYTLYGNHDDFDVIQRYKGWLPDGLSQVNGLRVFTVNGVWGSNREKLYHKNPNQMIRHMPDAGQVDLLLTHEHPALLDYQHQNGAFKFREEREWHKSFAEAVAKYLKPKIWCYGHSHTTIADRIIPTLNLRTCGLDGRAVLMDESFSVIEQVSLNTTN